ncbi:chymotrypsin inhibitor-like [Diabrotica virgifera virgifera]|uniref:Chymotrypsin inhibitor-like n=1 Tax=Diabrotica virgifera virgifera TaxID=50390 RepID=A0A6P7GXX9_DIAVI|nr:chymotrypsin inhibitor-like [Diabrotica virgifera virgifera]
MNKVLLVFVLTIVLSQVLAQSSDRVGFGFIKCGEHSVESCAPCCPEAEATCSNKVPQPCTGICTRNCLIQCRCVEGYLKDIATGKCVKEC